MSDVAVSWHIIVRYYLLHHEHCTDGSWRVTICKLPFTSQTEESAVGYLLKTPLASIFILKAQNRSRQGNFINFSESDDQ